MALGWCLIFLIATTVSAEIRVSLDSSTWNLQGTDVNIDAQVPGGVYSNLQAAGLIDKNLFYRFNDIDYRWVSNRNWTYSRTFDLSSDVLQKTKINLVFHGIDTVGEVYLNGQLLGSVDNMFVRYIYPVKSILKATGNILQIRLASPIAAAAALAASQPYNVPPDCFPDVNNGECHVNMLRKMQASFSWDWGPAFPSAGIWKSVELEAFDLAVVRDVLVVPQKVVIDNVTSWNLTITCFADLATESFKDISLLRVSQRNGKKLLPTSRASYEPSNGNYSYVSVDNMIFEASAVAEWWPNGFGDQPLYDVEVELISTSSDEIASARRTTAFRTVELVQEPLLSNATGLSFYFRVNGVPIFAKGSNWIPGHVLPEWGGNDDIISNALTSAAKVHMNMLRVWGGGVYESDAFYELADTLGIMIWQDMMFACAMYPTNSKYLSSVETEVEQQVRRLQSHPSIAVWAGNNENEAALRGNWYGTKDDFDLFKGDYVKLYVDTIKPVVESNDPSRQYVVSSPSNGADSEAQGNVAEDPYSAVFGDVHYYNYASDGWDSFTFPDTRFASEYGYQSFASFATLSTVSEPSDWSVNSNFSVKRQHHPNGFDEITGLIKQRLPLPIDDGSLLYFRTYIYYSQISQAMSTKTETEKYRRDRSKLTSDNKGNTMGALYWQLNDVWESVTWSSLEFGGRWKMLHYFAQKFFAPILISPELTPTKDLNIYAVSDLLVDKTDLTLVQQVYRFDNLKPAYESSMSVTAVNASSTILARNSVKNMMDLGNCSRATDCLMHFRLIDNNGTLISDNTVFNSLNETPLPTAILILSDPVTCGQGCISFTVNTNMVTAFVWLETDVVGTFSENGFTQLEQKKRVTFQKRSGDLEVTFKLTVRALNAPLTNVQLTPLYEVIQMGDH